MAAEYTSGSVRIPGLSGMDTDFDAMIDQLYEIEAMQAQQLIRWKNDWETRQDAFKDLRTELVNMQTALKKLNSPGKFLSKSYTSSRPEIASATLSSDSPVEDFTIFVKQLATNAFASYKTTMAEKSDQFGLGNNGSLTLGLASTGESFTVNVTDQTTLEGLVNIINNHPDNKNNVLASVVNTGSGYSLMIRSKNSGEDTVSVSSANLDIFGDGWDPLSNPNSENKKGVNALFTLNGSSTEISSKSNMVSDVVEGITFNLFEQGNSTRISVKLDKEKIKENVETFVESVNSLRTKIKELTAYNSSKQVVDPKYAESQFEMQHGSVLTGNYGVQLISSRLKNIIASTGNGFVHSSKQYAGDFFSALSQIGIMTNAKEGSSNYGLLEISDTKQVDSLTGTLSFDEAMDKDPEAIARLFAATMDPTVHNQGEFAYEKYIQGITKPGSYDVKYSFNTDGSMGQATVGGAAATYNEVTGELTVMDGDAKGLVLTIYDKTQGEHTGIVSLRQGKVNEILEALQGDGTQEGSGMLDKGFGTLTILEDEYTTIIKNINKKVLKEHERLAIWEKRMRGRFSRLEKNLAKYNQINESLKSQIASLNQSKS